MSKPNPPTLDVRDIEVQYGPFRAIFGVSFSIGRGTTVALLGPNGAGKSTIARTISGLVRPSKGSIIFDSTDISRTSAWKIARLGITQVPEGRGIFSSLSVSENLQLALRCQSSKSQVASLLNQAYETFPRLGERALQLAGTLSGGEQRILALARVLLIPPKLLIVDEMSLGLAPVIVDEVFAGLSAIKELGTSILLIEQHVNRALEFADQAVVLSKGEVILAGPVSELGDMDRILIPGKREG
jgi:branched-chain amino acid transport system ATP-binding protein